MNVECLDYRDLPGQHPLFSQYLYDYDSVGSFYPEPACLDLESLKQRADSVINNPPSFPRDQLVELMKAFNQKVGAGEETFRNLEKLKSSQAVVVVTGQQTGFLGGPAFTMYKALTAIRLTQLLNEEGYCAVPVFWLASDDSDFQEVHSTFFFGEDEEPFPVRYPDVDADRSRMAGTVSLEKVEECLKYLQTRGLKGEFQSEVLDMLRETYSPNHVFSEGLGAWLSRLFEPYGLVLFDPLTPGYKRNLKSLFHTAVNQRRDIVQALIQRADLLREKGFDPQVRVVDSESLIFWKEGDKRYKLEYGEKGGYEKKTDLSVRLSEEELLKELDDEHLAPNVLLRPILQDHLFPTVAYVGGPSEVAYFAQIGAISPFWNQEMAVFPRLGVTIVDRKSQRLLKKYGISASDLLKLTSDEVAHKVLQGRDSGKLLKQLELVQGSMRAQLKSLRDEFQEVDPTVAEMLVGTEKKIDYQIEKIEKRFVSNYRTRTENLGQHLNYLYSRLYPMGKLQERVVNFNQFLAEEGPSLVGRLMEAVNPLCPSHHLIYL
ncbi:MAG: bacillithiol biosynthesis cysteine-adding enzyme BshC [Acidobacteriota bacterium]